MNAAASVVPCDAVWLQFRDYHVVPLNPRLAGHIEGVEQAIKRGIPACPDLRRQDFYHIELNNAWAYIHVRDHAQTVYLVAYFSPGGPGLAVREERIHRFNGAVRLQARQVECLATALSQAFHDEPDFTYVFPDEQKRRILLPWFFRSIVIHASQFCGEIYTKGNIECCALWISPGRVSTFERMIRTRMLARVYDPVWDSKPYVNLRERLEEIRSQLVGGSFWYLLALAPGPAGQQEDAGGRLIAPILAQADADGMQCYVETFDERRLFFYEGHGFRVQGAGSIPPGGHNFWVMLRAPQVPRSNKP